MKDRLCSSLEYEDLIIVLCWMLMRMIIVFMWPARCVYGSDLVAMYRLPMDAVDTDGYIVNPSSLHAVLHRPTAAPDSDDDVLSTTLTRGVDGQAAQLDGSHRFIDIDTSALKSECFGDFSKCHMGKYRTSTFADKPKIVFVRSFTRRRQPRHSP